MVNGFTVWFTGLSGAGKSTLSGMLEARMRATGLRVELLDGDVVRTHLSKGLSFSKEDRDENIRRIGFVCELLSRNGVIAIVPPISPYRAVRDELRVRIRNFVEVYVESPIKVSAGHARLVEATIARWLRTGDPAKCRSTLCLIPIRA